MPFPTPVSSNHHDVYPAIDPSSASNSQKGKVVVISGGGQGIGISIARAFATAGASHVVLLGRTAKTLESTRSDVSCAFPAVKVSTFTADVTDESRIEEVFAEIERTIGPVDVVVANAGYFASGAYAEHPVDEFRRSLEINVMGPFVTSQAFLRHRAAKGATFVVVNTAAAHLPALMPSSAYMASKAAAARVVEAMQSENADVRAFSIHPGVVPTDMSRKAGMHQAANDTPEMAAGLSVYLATEQADFLKGRFVWAQWDVDELRKDWADRMEKEPSLFTMGMLGWPFDGKTTASAFD